VTAGVPAPPTEVIDEAALLLSLAARPVIWAGGGVLAAGASAELAAVAEVLGAPVVTSTSGKGAISEDHPLALGSTFAAREVARLLGDADAGLAVGTSFSARSTRGGGMALPMQLFQVDADPTVLGRVYPVRSGIVGDARAFLEGLAVSLERRGVRAREGAAERVAEIRAAARERLAASGPAEEDVAALRRAIPPEVPTVWDPEPARWGVPRFPVPVAGTFHAPPADAAPGSSPTVAERVAEEWGGPVVAVVEGDDPGSIGALARALGAPGPAVVVVAVGTVRGKVPGS